MKIKKLEISNIASIAKASINFMTPPLSDAPVFLICGPTGSGKSTILDAICLALYDKTPRLTNGKLVQGNTYEEGNQTINIQSVNQLLKKGEKEGGVSLLFEGADGSDYTAEWKCRVNRNGRLENETWSITDSTGHTDSSKGNARMDRMAEIIGLDYDEFCRTTMLAQGQFTLFLKAEAKEKSDILEKITGTEIYAKIGTRIHQKAKEAYDTLKETEMAVSSVELLSDDQRSGYLEEESKINDAISKDSAAIQLLDSLLKAFEGIATTKADIKASEDELDSARSMFTTLTGDLLFRKDSATQKREEAETLAANIKTQETHADMFGNIQAIESHLENITAQRRIIQQQEETLAAWKKVLGAAKGHLSELVAEKVKAQNTLDEKTNAVKAAWQAKEALNPDKVEKERQDLDKMLELIGQASTAYATIKQKEEDLTTANSDYAEADEDINAARTALTTLEGRAKEADREYQEARTVYEKQAQVLDKAAVRMREWIRNTHSTTCPVCNSKISGLPTEQHEHDLLKPVKDHLDNKEKEKKAADEAFTRARTELSANEASHSKADERIRQAKRDTAKLKEDFTSWFSRLGISGKEDNLTALLDSLKHSTDKRKQANEDAIADIQARQKYLDAANLDLDKFRKEVYDPAAAACSDKEKEIIAAETEISGAQGLLETAQHSEALYLSEAAKLISLPDWQKKWEENPAGFISTLKEKAGAYRKYIDAYSSLEQEIKALDGTIKSAGEAHGRILSGNSDFILESTAVEEFQGDPVFEWGVLESKITSAHKKREQAYRGKAVCEETLTKAFEQDASLPRDIDSILRRKTEISKDMMNQSAKQGEIKSKLEDDERKRSALEDKIEKRDAARTANAQWATMDSLFGGADGFIFKKIAQSYIMQDILDHANAYLRKIAPRYELTAQPGSLVILVRDNEDGGVRSGNTLSGGEGFVISLSLALGLSSLAENSIHVDTVFIDEGFGNLSQEWLNSVMAALEKLNSTSGRHVGIISHIEDLQKRIPTVIEVKKTDATTSGILIHG